MDTESFLTKYRPKTWDEVIGQDAIVEKLQRDLISPARPHSFVLLGPAGTGKTSIAGLIAKELGCSDFDLQKLRAPNMGIDETRQLIQSMELRPMTGKTKVAIIDECHALTSKSWGAFLVPTEEAPKHAYYVFSSTEEFEIPETNRQRSYIYKLKPVPAKLLAIYLQDHIVPEEKFSVIDGLIELIVTESSGSVRQALSWLFQLSSAKTLNEAKQFLHQFSIEESSIADLAKLLITGGRRWSDFNRVINKLATEDVSGIKYTLISYLSKVLSNTHDNDSAQKILFVLNITDTLKTQGTTAEIIASIQIMAGRCIFR